jgi:hypothetical protein
MASSQALGRALFHTQTHTHTNTHTHTHTHTHTPELETSRKLVERLSARGDNVIRLAVDAAVEERQAKETYYRGKRDLL